MKQSGKDPDDAVNFTQALVAVGKVKCSKLYAVASENSSIDMLHARRARNVSLSKNREDSETRPTSVEVVQLIPHEAQLALHRMRAMSNISENTLAELIDSNSSNSSTLDYRLSLASTLAMVRGSFGSNGQASITSSLRDGLVSCMRRRNDEGNDEYALRNPSLASLVSSTTRASSSLSEYKRKRVLSISYANGNTEIEEPVVECDGKRLSVVALKWGKGIDEIIPGKAYIV